VSDHKLNPNGAILLLTLSFAGAVIAATKPATAPAATHAVDADAPSQDDTAVRAKLTEPLKELRYSAAPLGKVFDDLATKSNVKIVVDWDVLKQAGISIDAPVTARLRGIRSSKALALIFKSVEGEDDDHKLGYYVDDGSVKVTTLTELAKRAVQRSYDISDLLAGQPGLPLAAKAKGPIVTNSSVEIERYITDNVESESWKENGGNVGEITFDRSKNALLITQTPETQQKVSDTDLI
jgi:hypothetical protein